MTCMYCLYNNSSIQYQIISHHGNSHFYQLSSIAIVTENGPTSGSVSAMRPTLFFVGETTLHEPKAPDSTWPKNNARCSHCGLKGWGPMGASPTKNTLFEENWSFEVSKWCCFLHLKACTGTRGQKLLLKSCRFFDTLWSGHEPRHVSTCLPCISLIIDLKSWCQELKSCMRQTVWHITLVLRVSVVFTSSDKLVEERTLENRSRWLIHVKYYTKLAM